MNTNTRVRDEKDVYFRYLDDISKYPLLTKEQEKILIRKVQQGSRAAMDMLVSSNLKFVVNIANMYKGQGIEVNELINEGNMGLMEAARRFDLNTNLKFISYAVWWVRQNITRAIAERGRMVRISAEKELVIRKFAKHGGTLRQLVGGGYAVDPKSLEGLSKYKAKDIEKILMMGNRSTSLDAPLGGSDGDITLGDTLFDKGNRVEELAERNDSHKRMDNILSETLSDQENEIIRLYFGFNMDADLNLKEIAPMVGLSKERTRLIKENALEKLRSDRRARALNDAA